MGKRYFYAKDPNLDPAEITTLSERVYLARPLVYKHLQIRSTDGWSEDRKARLDFLQGLLDNPALDLFLLFDPSFLDKIPYRPEKIGYKRPCPWKEVHGITRIQRILKEDQKWLANYRNYSYVSHHHRILKLLPTRANWYTTKKYFERKIRRYSKRQLAKELHEYYLYNTT